MEPKTKIIKAFKYKALGFEITIRDAPFTEFQDDWVFEVPPPLIGDTIYKQLAEYPARLTGNHVKFIRKHNRMNTRKFAERLGVTNAAVTKWEKKGDDATGMAWSTEKDIRLMVASQTVKSGDRFRRLYEKLEEPPEPGAEAKPFVYRVNARKKLVAA
jgi:hypothetical protein